LYLCNWVLRSKSLAFSHQHPVRIVPGGVSTPYQVEGAKTC
jgi:hypothetical protein